MSGEALKPCPFCDDEVSESDVGQWGDDHLEGWWLRCMNCGADGPSRGTPAEAIEAWNRRPGEDGAYERGRAEATAAIVADLRQAADFFDTDPEEFRFSHAKARELRNAAERYERGEHLAGKERG